MPARRNDGDEMLPHYDFSGGVRGKHVERMKTMRLKVMLEPDVARVFPTSEAVNEALRTLTRIETARKRRPSAPRRKKAG
jgi:hypothetical protein